MKKIFLAFVLTLWSVMALAGPVNVNTADAKTIAKELVGVGDKIAEEIVKERAKAPFKDAADLKKRVKGIGEKLIEKNKDNLLFAGK